MAGWVTDLNATTPDGDPVEYQSFKQNGYSAAERRARVKVGSKIVATGWASDGVTYEAYRSWVQDGCAPAARR